MRILVADNDTEALALVVSRLRARDHEVFEAKTSEAALRLLDRETVEVILIDSEMERFSGEHLVEKIRKKPHLNRVPVIMMTEEDHIAQLVMGQERGFDDFLVKPFKPFELQLRVVLNSARTRQRIEANALTHLPGNATIERVIRDKIDRGDKFSVLYIDINHFKSFNDRYGFEKGDDVIRQTAKILTHTVDEIAESQDAFVGHVGGDDFIVVLPPEKEEPFAQAFIAEFDRLMPTYYSETDQKRGMIRVTNRQGKREGFPIMSCAVAACTNIYRPYKNLGEIAQDAADLKSFLKSQPGSQYLRDRRSAQVQNIEEAVRVLEPAARPVRKVQRKIDPLGQILVGAGLISHEQLSLALKKHLETGNRLGQILISMNAVKSQDVGRMLEKKLNIPYVSLDNFQPTREILRLFTWEFMKSRRVVPLEPVGDSIRLAMCDPFDLRTIDAIERITGLKPIPCLALEDEFEQFSERFENNTELKEKII